MCDPNRAGSYTRPHGAAVNKELLNKLNAALQSFKPSHPVADFVSNVVVNGASSILDDHFCLTMENFQIP